MRYLFAKFEKRGSIQLYHHIYVYIKIMKNNRFYQKINRNKYKNENLLRRVVIPST